MKTEEFAFNSESELDEASQILIKMREEKPAPNLAERHYVAVALGDEGEEFKRRLEVAGIAHQITFQGNIPDEKFVNA